MTTWSTYLPIPAVVPPAMRFCTPSLGLLVETVVDSAAAAAARAACSRGYSDFAALLAVAISVCLWAWQRRNRWRA